MVILAFLEEKGKEEMKDRVEKQENLELPDQLGLKVRNNLIIFYTHSIKS